MPSSIVQVVPNSIRKFEELIPFEPIEIRFIEFDGGPVELFVKVRDQDFVQIEYIYENVDLIYAPNILPFCSEYKNAAGEQFIIDRRTGIDQHGTTHTLDFYGEPLDRELIRMTSSLSERDLCENLCHFTYLEKLRFGSMDGIYLKNLPPSLRVLELGHSSFNSDLYQSGIRLFLPVSNDFHGEYFEIHAPSEPI